VDNRWLAAELGLADVVTVPIAVAVFAHQFIDDGNPPREWAERLYSIRRWALMPRGGHFPSVEEPELLGRDVAAFFDELGLRAWTHSIAEVDQQPRRHYRHPPGPKPDAQTCLLTAPGTLTRIDTRNSIVTGGRAASCGLRVTRIASGVDGGCQKSPICLARTVSPASHRQ